MRTTLSFFAILLIAGCTADTGAVKTFSALAPDGAKLHTLTQAYARAPDELQEVDVLHDLSGAERTVMQESAKIRHDQVETIDGVHTLVVNYMKSLGALADGSLVQTSSDTKALTDGLGALSKAEPKLGITTDQISAVGSVSTLLADALTYAYRQEKLAEVIDKGEGPFQDLIGVEEEIISNGVIPELKNVRKNVDHLDQVTSALIANAEKAQKANASHAQGSQDIDPRLQGAGAANLASAYLLQRSIQSDEATLDRQIEAATAYLKALDDIGRAHTVLYKKGHDILSTSAVESMMKDLKPLVSEAYKSLAALQKI